MIQPNDNSLAQIAWASKKTGLTLITHDINIPFASEAMTRRFLDNGEYSTALDQCISWMIDEPFSSIPAVTGSYIAALFEENYDCAEQFCLLGLKANPTDKMLLNNYSVVLAKTGRIKKAIVKFKEIGKLEKKPDSHLTLLATSGLLLMRNGNVLEGRIKYQESINMAIQKNFHEAAAMIGLHLVLEEIEHGELDTLEVNRIISRTVGSFKSNNVNYLKNIVINKLKNYKEKIIQLS